MPIRGNFFGGDKRPMAARGWTERTSGSLIIVYCADSLEARGEVSKHGT